MTTVIVNYRLKYFLEQTLRSVEEAYSAVGGGRTIVIDNNSGDDSIDYLEQRFPQVTFVRNSKNVGFSRANNQGFKMSDTEYVLILNPDTIIGRSTISDCIKCMEEHKDCGCIGVKMTDGNGKFLAESKRSFPSVWNSFCKLFGLSVLFPKSRLFGRYSLKYLSTDEMHKVDVLSGAFMFVRRCLLNEVGGFDEDFFMYGEDIDLSYRLKRNGFVNYYLPTPIIHYKGECTKSDSVDYVRVFYQAMHIFYKKHYPDSHTLGGLFVRSAIGFRMCVQGVKNLLVNPIVSSIKRFRRRPIKSYILSVNPQNVVSSMWREWGEDAEYCQLDSVQSIAQCSEKCNIILDDRMLSYDQIVRTIGEYSSVRRNFHIYASSADVIISPKRQR